MSFHVPTLFAVIIAVSAVLAVAIGFIGRQRHRNLLLWATALGVQALGYVLYGLRGQVPDWASVVVANVCMSGALAVYALGIRRFHDQRWPVWWAWAPVAVIGLSFPFLLDNFTARLLLGSSVYGLQLLFLAAVARQQRHAPRGRGEQLLVFGALLMATMMAARTWTVATGQFTVQQLFQGGTLQSLTFLFTLTGTLLLALGLIIMNEDRAEHALRQNQRYQAFRNRILELLAQGTPLPTLLHEIVQGIETLHPRMLCSILLLDRQGQHLQTGAAPSLPAFYNDAVQGLPIGPGAGSCGTAAHTRQRVVVEDIASHPYWAPYRELAAQAGLGACWSQPIFSSEQRVLGTFAIYHHCPHTPSPADIALIEEAALLAGIAIERSREAQQLLERERHYRLLIETANEGIAVIQNGVLRFANPRFFQLCGHTPAEVLNQPLAPLIHEDDRDRVIRASAPADGQAAPQHHTFRVLTRHQGERWFELNDAPFEWLGQPATLSFMTDITERRRLEAKIQQQALHDTLTELPNRRLLTHNLAQAMASHRRSGLHGALMFLDLDNFKPLNDTHGHRVGDLLLVEVAHRLTHSVRETDTVARFGGDEFVVLLGDLHTDPQTSVELARAVAGKLLAALAEPYCLAVEQASGGVHAVEHRCTASIGVVMFDGQATEPDDLLKQADMAMYRAKAAGRNTVWLAPTAPTAAPADAGLTPG